MTAVANLCLTLLVGIALAPAPAFAQVGPAGSVRVTVPRANVRSEPGLQGTVLTQVTRDTILPVQSVEGDWYQVRVSMGDIRFEAYISNTVCERIRDAEPEPVSEATGGITVGPAEPRFGMTVGFQPLTEGSMNLAPVALRVVPVPGDEASLEVLGRTLPESGTGAGSGEDHVTWTWLAPADAAAPSLDDAQPRFIVSIAGLADLDPEDFSAAIVRLVPAPDGRRVVAAAPGRADQPARTRDDWDVVDDLREDVVPSIVTRLEPATLNIQPRDELGPGEYAVVVRPTSGDDLAGAVVLSERGEGQVFSTAWLFTVPPR